MENKCHYCGGPAVHFFKTSNYWCCENRAMKCPAIREKKKLSMLERYKDYPTAKIRRSVEDGTAKCFYCGETAYFVINGSNTCCKNKANSCPEYSKAIGLIIKKNYEENPERSIKMSKIMKKVQNRSIVKEKKSNSMLELHRGNCEPCIEFQTNYKEGMDKRNVRNHLKAHEFLISVGFKEDDIPVDMKERAIVVNRVKASLK